MKVSATTHISDIKNAFSEQFEGLKIEFFKSSHDTDEASPKEDMIGEDLPLGDLNSNMANATLAWNKDMAVQEVEEFFEKNLGLHVQVFCRLGRNWIETSATDSYSLREQMDRHKATV